MPKEEVIKVTGRVVKSLPNAEFLVEITDANFLNKPAEPIRAHLSGKMRIKFIRVLPGDEVTLELSPYDPGKGRIVYRLK